ncbi:MAG: hypothetical protein QF886_01585 [Planctomycetota bacterium]|jgi:hypothetical protein|nr:hypothetical protein [Planctomycetota bacterium]
MFFRIYVILCLLDALILIGTVLVSLIAPPATDQEFISRHMVPALSGIVLATFLHSMIVFYFIGVTKPMREVIAKLHGGAEELIAEARSARGIATFWATSGLIVIIIIAGLGGAAQNAFILPSLHGWLASLGGLITLWAHFREMVAVATNIELIRRINMQYAEEVRVREGEVIG